MEAFATFSFLDATGQEREQPAHLDKVPEGSGQTPAPGRIYLGRYPQNLSGLVTVRSDSSRLALRAAHFRRVPPRGSTGSFYVYDGEPFKPSYTENDFFLDYRYDWRLGDTGDTRITFNPSVHYFSYLEQSFMTFGINRRPPLGERSGKAAEFNHYQLKVTFDRQLLPELNVIAGLDGLFASFYRSDGISIERDKPALGPLGDTGRGLAVGVVPREQRVVLRPNGYSELGKWFLGGAFGQAVWSPARQLTLTLGARFDTFGGEADPEITPRLGIVYKPVPTAAVKLLYGRSYLAPMWAHKRANDDNFRGNPGLEPETFESYGLVFAYATPRLSGSVDFFYNRVENLINAVQRCDNSVSRYQNIGESLYMGADVEAKAQATTWLSLRGSYSLIVPGIEPSHGPSCPPGATEREAPRLIVERQIRDIPRHTIRYGLRLEPTAALGLSVWGRATSTTTVLDEVRFPDPMQDQHTTAAAGVLHIGDHHIWPGISPGGSATCPGSAPHRPISGRQRSRVEDSTAASADPAPEALRAPDPILSQNDGNNTCGVSNAPGSRGPHGGTAARGAVLGAQGAPYARPALTLADGTYGPPLNRESRRLLDRHLCFRLGEPTASGAVKVRNFRWTNMDAAIFELATSRKAGGWSPAAFRELFPNLAGRLKSYESRVATLKRVGYLTTDGKVTGAFTIHYRAHKGDHPELQLLRADLYKMARTEKEAVRRTRAGGGGGAGPSAVGVRAHPGAPGEGAGGPRRRAAPLRSAGCRTRRPPSGKQTPPTPPPRACPRTAYARRFESR